MSIFVNNKEIEWVKNETVTDLLQRMRYTFPLVVVKINGRVIPKKKFSETHINDNVKIEVIHMISGG